MNSELTKLINANEGLIYSIITKYQNYIDIEDLYQVGVIGLINAHNNYNSNYNVKFSTYAYSYIFGEVMKLVNESKTIKIGRMYRGEFKKISHIENILTQKLMRKPTTSEIASYLETDESTVSYILSLGAKVESLDYCIEQDGQVIDRYESIPDTKSNIDINSIYLRDEIDKLSDIERSILKERYYQDRTQKEIANMFGMSQVQVSRVESKSLKTLYHQMRV